MTNSASSKNDDNNDDNNDGNNSAKKIAPKRTPYYWGGLMFAGFGAIAGLNISGFISTLTGMVLGLLVMCLLIPLVKSTHRGGAMNSAILRYGRRIILASFLYFFGLNAAILLWDRFDLSAPASFGLALLPTIPGLMMIWAMARYLAEEEDEYLRYRAVTSSIYSLGFVLALGTFYGFLEMFGFAPHIWAFWVLPVWALGLGVAQIFHTARSK